MALVERWPPCYDAEQLAAQIKDLSDRGELFKNFYGEEPRDVAWCQGDIVALTPSIPFLDEEGPAVAEVDILSGWLLLSNTCDLHRPLDVVEWAQAVPIYDLGTDNDLDIGELHALRKYSQSRRFYVPDWADRTPTRHHVADFTRPVTIARVALSATQRLARLSQTGWILLHSCLVRFLARDDGRYD